MSRWEMFKTWAKLSAYSIGGLVILLLFLLVGVMVG